MDGILLSIDELLGFDIRPTDGDIGHVEDFFARTSGWVIRYLLVATRNLLPGKKMLLPPDWIREVEHESALYGYYGRPGYWETER